MVGGWLLIGQLPEAGARGDPQFYQSLLRTATYAAVTVPVQLSLGLLLAYLLFYEVAWGKSFYRIVFFIPYVAPTVATAAVFAVIFSLDKTSPANQIVGLLGIPPQQWLRDTRGVFEIIAQLIGGRQVHLPSFLVGPSLPLMSAIIYSIWVFSGYDSVIFLAGLGNVPHELVEASQVDGAGRWSIFRHIIFPMISPTTFFLTMLAIIGTFKAFDYIYVLRQDSARGAMDTATVYIFELIRTGSKSWSYAASAAFVLFGIVLVLTLIQNRLSRDRVFYG
jgi:multiple sugar transport system permease protein